MNKKLTILIIQQVETLESISTNKISEKFYKILVIIYSFLSVIC